MRRGTVIALALVGAIATVTLLRGNDGVRDVVSTPTTSTATTATRTTAITTTATAAREPAVRAASLPTRPTAVSISRLKRLANRVMQPIYWAGRAPRVTYALMQTRSGRIYVRYLPRGARPTDPRPVRTVATYRLRDAFLETRALANERSHVAIRLPRRGIGVYDTGRPTNIYVAYSGTDYQIEVFDPRPGSARRLAESGRIVPIR